MDEKIKQAIDELKGKPIEDFSGIMHGSLQILQFFVMRFFEDGDVDDDELKMLCNVLDPMQAAAHYEDDLRQKAHESARSYKADKNNATKV